MLIFTQNGYEKSNYMNNIVTNFKTILQFAERYGLPKSKKRAIVREYLQIKILDFLYRQPIASDLVFIGGTSLRLTRSLDRFSEDMDFDISTKIISQIDKTIEKMFASFKQENISLDLYKNTTENRNYYEFRFTNLLFELGISTNKDEKLMIKFDFETNWKKHQKEVLLVNRYGFLINVTTIPLEEHLVQKLTAYISRKQTLARDIYDLVWILAQEVRPDWQFAKNNGLEKDLIIKAINKFEEERKKLKTYQARLNPFLIEDIKSSYLEHLPTLLKKI